MTAELRFAGGHTGRVRCSLWSSDLLQIERQGGWRPRRAACAQSGDTAPFRRLSVRSADGKRVERFPRRAILRVSA